MALLFTYLGMGSTGDPAYIPGSLMSWTTPARCIRYTSLHIFTCCAEESRAYDAVFTHFNIVSYMAHIVNDGSVSNGGSFISTTINSIHCTYGYIFTNNNVSCLWDPVMVEMLIL